MSIPSAMLKLGPEDHGRRISSEEYANAEFQEPWSFERVDGRLIAVAPAGEEHALCAEPWRDRLVLYKLQHPGVIYLVISEAWLRVDGSTDRIGDIGVYLQTEEPRPKVPDRVPDLMFEIVSPDRRSRSRDYVDKRADYHRFGVREYVIIDRFNGNVTVLQHAPEGYREQILRTPETYTTPLLPGLAIPLAEVL